MLVKDDKERDILGISGGKDSAALAVYMSQNSRIKYRIFFH